jgi:hypothetical protein
MRPILLLAALSCPRCPLVRTTTTGTRAGRKFSAELRGRNEVPLVLSDARGSLSLEVNEADTSVHFVLEFSGLQTTVLFAHIHVAQPDVNGAVTVFFCGGGGRRVPAERNGRR